MLLLLLLLFLLLVYVACSWKKREDTAFCHSSGSVHYACTARGMQPAPHMPEACIRAVDAQCSHMHSYLAAASAVLQPMYSRPHPPTAHFLTSCAVVKVECRRLNEQRHWWAHCARHHRDVWPLLEHAH
jgi:hypothetical protein